MHYTDFDAILPRWEQSPSVIAGGRDGTGADVHNWASYRGGGRTLPLRDITGRITSAVKVPSAMYVRAVDPAGSLVALVVCTNRVNTSDIEVGRIKERKQRGGWLLLDEPDHRLKFGATLDDWHAHCRSEMGRRQGEHQAASAKFSQSFRTHEEAIAGANEKTLRDLFLDLLGKSSPTVEAPKRGRPAHVEAGVNG